MELVILSSETESEFELKLSEQLSQYNADDMEFDELTYIKNNEMPKKISIVINGSTLVWAMSTENPERRV
jgi:hypothetical protein